VEVNGRRATMAELYWDKNRDPSQKVAVNTVLEPSDRNSDDWNGSAEFIYPGSAISGKFSTITLSNACSRIDDFNCLTLISCSRKQSVGLGYY
jgi:hypothetical protein